MKYRIQSKVHRPQQYAAIFRILLSACVCFLISHQVQATLVYADLVTLAEQGPGVTHANFIDPNSVLGAPDYSGGARGTGAYSLGISGRITVRMATPFSGDGTAAFDIVIYEVGPATEDTLIEISPDKTTWTSIATTPGGTAGIDLDALGFGPAVTFRFVRITDGGGGSLPDPTAGADIDAIGVHTVPEPGSASLFLCVAVISGLTRRFRTRRPHVQK